MMKVLLIVVAVGVIGCSTDSSKSTGLIGAKKIAVERVITFLKTADTTNLHAIFADSLLQLISIEQMVAERTLLIDQCGRVMGVEGPFVDSSSEVRVLINFELKALDVWLGFNSDQRINSMEITNAPICDSIPIHSNARTNATVEVQDLQAMTTLASQFDADTGFVRLVALLSPT